MYDYYTLALPPKKTFTCNFVTWSKYNEKVCKDYINNLKRRPKWYEHPKKDPNYDTREYILQHPQEFKSKSIKFPDPFKNKLALMFLCANCGWGVTYSGVDIGHINNWKDELYKAGVAMDTEARAVYNNLLNLQIECSTCNRSHDWE